MSDIAFAILEALHQHGEIRGTEKLAELLHRISDKRHVYAQALILYRRGMIEIIPSTGGRGKKTIYRDLGVLKVRR